MAQKLSASKAAKMVGKSVPTITRAIKSGKLSAQPNPDGGWLIDPAELARVWDVRPETDNETGKMLVPVTPNITLETSVLQVKLEAKDQRIADLERELAKAEASIEDWKDQAKTLAIANQNQSQGQGATPPEPVIVKQFTPAFWKWGKTA